MRTPSEHFSLRQWALVCLAILAATALLWNRSSLPEAFRIELAPWSRHVDADVMDTLQALGETHALQEAGPWHPPGPLPIHFGERWPTPRPELGPYSQTHSVKARLRGADVLYIGDSIMWNWSHGDLLAVEAGYPRFVADVLRHTTLPRDRYPRIVIWCGSIALRDQAPREVVAGLYELVSAARPHGEHITILGPWPTVKRMGDKAYEAEQELRRHQPNDVEVVSILRSWMALRRSGELQQMTARGDMIHFTVHGFERFAEFQPELRLDYQPGGGS